MSRQSKFLSLVLRHKPEEIDLTLDSQGWARIDDLLKALKKAGRGMTRADLDILVADNDKKRFTFSEDGRRIRAAQGHSIPIDLNLTPTQPPEFLYHGTASSSLDSIFANGLVPGKRQHVHLSLDPQTATRVGQRHGKPVVLRINTGQMANDGHVFLKADNGVWLTAHVPSTYLGFGAFT